MKSLLERLQIKVERTLYTGKPNHFYRWATPQQISNVQPRNREALSRIDRWFDPAHRVDALFDLGLPERLEPLIDRPIGTEVTPADLLAAVAENLEKPINFLEIGTSIGKNVYQTLFIPGGGRRVAVDIETMNPILRRRFGVGEMVSQWSTPAGSVLPVESTWEKFHPTEANIDFESVRGDFNDPEFWNRLGGQFNLIYYDALARDFAVRACWENMKRVQTFGPGRFAWIINNTDMTTQQELQKIAAEMSSIRKEKCHYARGWIAGWVGDHEPNRRVSIIANWLV
jgi:hypothetical protein